MLDAISVKTPFQARTGLGTKMSTGLSVPESTRKRMETQTERNVSLETLLHVIIATTFTKSAVIQVWMASTTTTTISAEKIIHARTEMSRENHDTIRSTATIADVRCPEVDERVKRILFFWTKTWGDGVGRTEHNILKQFRQQLLTTID
jgi:hypothetical protein